MSDRSPSGLVAAAEKLPHKLEGSSNYIMWSYHVMSAVEGFNLDGHLAGDSIRPLVDGADTTKTADWDRNDKAVRACIKLSLTPSMISHVMSGNLTAKQMWDKLATQCRRHDMASRGALIRQIHTTKLKDAAGAEQHISAMSGFREQLAQMGKSMDESEAAFALLHSVPTDVIQWDIFLRTYHAKADDPTWDGVCSEIRVEATLQQQRNKERVAIQPVNAAVAEVAYNANSKKQNGCRTPRFCTHCNKTGHVEETCFTLHPQLRNQQQQRQQHHHFAGSVTTDGPQAIGTAPGIGLWHVDSGASAHLTGNKAWFTQLHECPPCTVTTANHGVLTCSQRGTVKLNTQYNCFLTFDNVLFVPSLVVNLLSVSAILRSGYRVRFTGKGCTIRTRHNKHVVRAVSQDNIFSVQAWPPHTAVAHSVTSGSSGPLDWKTVHARLGHLNPTAMKALLDKQMVLGVTTPTGGSVADIDHCTGCLTGKSHRQPFPAEASHRATRPLEIVHSDVCGPIQAEESHTAAEKTAASQLLKYYILTFIDDYSRNAWLAITTDKSGTTVMDHFKRFKAWAERYTGFNIKTLRTDGGGEYVNDQFITYLYTMGVERQVTVARSPQQNGVAERLNRTLMEAARALLHASGLPFSFWKYAVKTAVYLRNRSPTKALANATPYQAWRGDTPDLSHLRVFGCRAYMHLDKTKRSKLQARSIPVIFVGYASEAKAWLVYDPVSKKEYTSRDVTFHESVAGCTLLNEPGVSAAVPSGINSSSDASVRAAEPVGTESSVSVARAAEPTDTSSSNIFDLLLASDTDSDDDDGVTEAKQPVRPSVAAVPVIGVASELPATAIRVASESPATDIIPPRIPPKQAGAVSATVSQVTTSSSGGSLSSKQRRRLTKQERALRQLAPHNSAGRTEWTDEQQHAMYYALAAHVGDFISEPSTYKEAVRSPYRVQWERAMQEELDSIKANNTYTLVPLPIGRQAIGCKWVYKIKRHADGSIDRYKARLVAKGYSQLYGIDFTETFAPVARFSSLRAILAIAAAADYEIHQISTMTTLLAHINSNINPNNINQPTAGEPSSIQLPATSHP